ncbi:putative Longin-like domain superfamily protein [Plasmopara halstedii]
MFSMIDHFVIFSKTGTVLWSRTLCKLSGDPVDSLISRSNGRSCWRKEKILQLLYIEELLESSRKISLRCSATNC